MLNLFFRKYGEQNPPIVILHGLFGMSDNWHNIAKRLSENFTVYTLDLRNHGNSPHTFEMNFKLMAEDVNNFIENENIGKIYLIGHSLGGKVCMMFANLFPQKILKMIVVDISPKQYSASHYKYINAMKEINYNSKSRIEIEENLSKKITNRSELLFILKNLIRTETNNFALKINLDSIEKNYENLIAAIDFIEKIKIPVLFLKGEFSNYINSDDEIMINNYFLNAQIKTIKNAEHWIHADNPNDFLSETNSFFKN
ncbi:MAG: alpha/beta fold hydrolase [Bacteroidetes bacterium]|nr:alpha/beta fold hydrolase [Bacteroidota bacterium]